MKEIKLTQGKVALVDDEDFKALNQFKWYAHKYRNTFYANRGVGLNGKQITQSMHGVIMNGKGIDHHDHNGLNNQKSNLRLCTQSENCMNRSKMGNTSSIYKGVHFHKPNNKWLSSLRINGKHVHLGLFVSEIDAARAYNAKAVELFGEFVNLNNIN